MLTWGAPQAQAAFMSAVGHEKMLELLLRAGSPVPLPLVSSLFNWFACCPAQMRFVGGGAAAGRPSAADAGAAAGAAAGGSWSADESAWESPLLATVQMGEVGGMLVGVLPHCTVEVQLALLQRLEKLLTSSVLNRSRCSELRLLRQMLQQLATPLTCEIQIALLHALTPLASHSVSVSELKLLFRLLAQQPAEGSTLLHAELLAIVSSMLRQHGPAAFFLFDGHNSGLALPALPKLSQGGYTFYAWVRVESFFAPATVATWHTPPSHTAVPRPASSAGGAGGAGEWEPRLLALRDDQGRGIELAFVRERANGT